MILPVVAAATKGILAIGAEIRRDTAFEQARRENLESQKARPYRVVRGGCHLCSILQWGSIDDGPHESMAGTDDWGRRDER